MTFSPRRSVPSRLTSVGGHITLLPSTFPGELSTGPGYLSVDLRSRFVVARRRLAASLRSTDPLVGFVGRRGGGGGAVASVSNSESLVAAASRLRNCDRYSEATTVITPFESRLASARSARSLSGSGSAADAARS